MQTEINMKKKKGGKGNRKCLCGGGVAILNKVVKGGCFWFVPFYWLG